MHPKHSSFHSKVAAYNTRTQSQMLALRLLSLQANQLFKHTSLLTLAGERAARDLLTINPDFEKIRSQGTVVAGVPR